MENKKKEKTTIDIILPNYNSSQFISKTINSVLSQTYKNWKLILNLHPFFLLKFLTIELIFFFKLLEV